MWKWVPEPHVRALRTRFSNSSTTSISMTAGQWQVTFYVDGAALFDCDDLKHINTLEAAAAFALSVPQYLETSAPSARAAPPTSPASAELSCACDGD